MQGVGAAWGPLRVSPPAHSGQNDWERVSGVEMGLSGLGPLGRCELGFSRACVQHPPLHCTVLESLFLSEDLGVVWALFVSGICTEWGGGGLQARIIPSK